MPRYSLTSRSPSTSMSGTYISMELSGEEYGLSEPYEVVHDGIIQGIKALLLEVYPDATLNAQRIDTVYVDV